MNNFNRTLIGILFIILGFSNLFSQTGKITGYVFDKIENTPLIGANVIVTGTTYGAASNMNGYFEILNVPVGTYSIQATVIGFIPQIKTDIVVSSVKPVSLNYQLESTVLTGEGIVVKPNYFLDAVEKPISSRMQTNEEIRRLPGGLQDVVRAISILPGVAQVQSGRNDLIVRGGAPSENLYVVDGLEISNINHFGTQGATGGPLSFINLDYVESTLFSTGGFGVRYGDKLSSVLTLDLKNGRTDRMGGKGTISASQFGFDIEGPLKDKGSFFFTARRSYLDFIFKAAGFGFVPEYWDFMGKANYKLSSNDELTVLGILALDKTKFFNDTPEKRYTNSRILGSSQDQWLAGITWRHLFRGGFSTLTIGQTEIDYDFFQYDTLKNPIFLNKSIEHENTLTGNVVYNLTKSFEINWGIQSKLVSTSNDIFMPEFISDFGESIAVDLDVDDKGIKYASWLQSTMTLKQLKFILGVRWDHMNFYDAKNAISPRGTISYSLFDKTQLNLHMGRYYQAPSLIWLNANPQNQTLNFTRTDQYILGLEQLLKQDLQLTIEGYYKNYSNYPSSLSRPYLVMANTGAGFGGSSDGFASFGLDPLDNIGSGWARGIELFIQKKLSERPWYGILSVSFNQSEFKGLDGISRPSSYDQRWILNIGGGYVLNKNWEFAFKSRFATGRPYTPYNEDYSKSSELYNTKRVKNNWILDLRADRFWYFDKFVLITYADIQNVLNRDIYDVPRYNAFDDELEDGGSIGILPSIGISIEF